MRIYPPHGIGPAYDVPDHQINVARHLSQLQLDSVEELVRQLPTEPRQQFAYMTAQKLKISTSHLRTKEAQRRSRLHAYHVAAIALCLLAPWKAKSAVRGAVAELKSSEDLELARTWMRVNIAGKTTIVEKTLRVTAAAQQHCIPQAVRATSQLLTRHLLRYS